MPCSARASLRASRAKTRHGTPALRRAALLRSDADQRPPPVTPARLSRFRSRRAQLKAFRFLTKGRLPDSQGKLAPVAGKEFKACDFPPLTQMLNLSSFVVVPSDARLAELPIMSAAFQPFIASHRAALVSAGPDASGERRLAASEDDEAQFHVYCYRNVESASITDLFSVGLAGLIRSEAKAIDLASMTTKRGGLPPSTISHLTTWAQFAIMGHK